MSVLVRIIRMDKEDDNELNIVTDRTVNLVTRRSLVIFRKVASGKRWG